MAQEFHAGQDVTLRENGLDLRLGGQVRYFNYYWLRDASSDTIDPQTRERVFDIACLADRPSPEWAKLEREGLRIRWRNDNSESLVSFELLERYFLDPSRRDPADLPRNLWQGDHAGIFARFRQADVERDPDERSRFARALIVDGVAIVGEMENSDDSLTRLVNTLGPVTPSVDGLYFDVQFKIEPTNLAYTANALELHTDLPNEEAAPGIQFLHCRANSVEGGASLFVDGAAVAETFRQAFPDDFHLLATHDVPFFRRHENWDYRSHQRIIELDTHGAVSGLTISQHLQDNLDLPQELLDTFYPALVRFLQMLREERFVARFRLSAGECIVFDNHRIVHGREAYIAASGERHLRGCYTDRGALRSTYRVLLRKGHDGLATSAPVEKIA